MRILHTGDWHIEDKEVEEIEDNCNFMLDHAEKEKVDLILHSGDSTNSQNLKLDSLSTKAINRLFSRMANIAPVAVCLGTNSHDGLAPEVYSYIKGKYPIYVSLHPEIVFLYENNFHDFYDINMTDPDALISFCPPPSKQFFNTEGSIEEVDLSVQKALGVIFASFGNSSNDFDCPHIHVGHYNVAGSKISETQQLIGRDIEVSKEQLNMLNADLICLGHIHKQQKIGDDIFYPGSMYKKTFGELDDKGFYIHEIYPNDFNVSLSSKSEFIKVPAIHKTIHEYDFINDPSDNLMEDILHFLDEFTANGKYQLRLKLYQEQVKELNRAEIERYYIQGGALSCDIKLEVIPREITRNKEVHIAKTLHEKLKILSVSRGDEIDNETLDRADNLEGGMTAKELIKKYEVA